MSNSGYNWLNILHHTSYSCAIKISDTNTAADLELFERELKLITSVSLNPIVEVNLWTPQSYHSQNIHNQSKLNL